MKKPILGLFLSITLLCACSKSSNDDPADPSIDIIVCMHRNAVTENFNIIGMTPDGLTKKVLFAGTTEITEPKQGTIGSDGKTLLFSENNLNNLYTYDMETGSLHMIYDIAANAEGRTFEVPIFSPDMKLIYAFDDNNRDFCTINPVTKEVKVIYSGTLINPSFAADGRTIVCDAGWNQSIGVIQSDGTGFQMIKEQLDESGGGDNWGTTYMHPSAVKALNRIVYIKYEWDTRTNTDVNGIFIMNMDGSGETMLAEGNYISPSANGNGSKIAFMKNNREDNGTIVVRDYNGTALTTAPLEIPVGENIWRPYFNRILPNVFAALPDFVNP